MVGRLELLRMGEAGNGEARTGHSKRASKKSCEQIAAPREAGRNVEVMWLLGSARASARCSPSDPALKQIGRMSLRPMIKRPP